MRDKLAIRREACHCFVLVSLLMVIDVGATPMISSKIPDQHAATDTPGENICSPLLWQS